LPLHASRVAPLPTTKSRANSPYICNMLNDHCHRVSTHLQLIKIIIINPHSIMHFQTNVTTKQNPAAIIIKAPLFSFMLTQQMTAP